jgi:glycosyltransferase involved in cell wall biosynthesis
MSQSTQPSLLSDGVDCHLFISLQSRTLSGDIAAIVNRVGMLKRRFGFSAVIVCATPAGLGLPTIRKALRDEIFEQVICSGDENYVHTDIFAAAKRAIRKSAVFLHSSDLIANFPGVLKFIIESSNQDQASTISRCGRFLFTAPGLLKRAALHTVCMDWTKAIRAAASELSSVTLGADAYPGANVVSEVNGSGADQEVDSGYLPPAHLFVTLNGASRFGGLNRMVSLPLCFESTPVSQFAQCWVIDNDAIADHEAADKANTKLLVHTIKGFEQVAQEDRYLIFDINPAPLSEASAAGSHDAPAITVPRQVLYARAVKGALPAAQQQDRAVFIVSNHNKARYIRATFYSMLMQSYPKICIEFVDDLSTDNSMILARNFRDVLGIGSDTLSISVNAVNRGTYWIRNSVIARHIDSVCLFLVNDSDDYSAAQRIFLQAHVIAMQPNGRGCFGDIVRVDRNYRLLPLGEQVERYGTASLACRAELHNEAGYFQNIRKNADTEFIERIKTFLGSAAIKWFRYPVLFQPFDGGNLTADIYTFEQNGNQIVQSLGNRSSHTDAFKKHHARLSRAELPDHFTFPRSSMPKDYADIGSGFHIDGYANPDSCLLICERVVAQDDIAELLERGFLVASRSPAGCWIFSGPDRQDNYGNDTTFWEAFQRYLRNENFYGYALSMNWTEHCAKDLISPASLLAGPMHNYVLRSKSHGDRRAYIMDDKHRGQSKHGNDIDPEQLFMLLEQQVFAGKAGAVFFHSDVVLRSVNVSQAAIGT